MTLRSYLHSLFLCLPLIAGVSRADTDPDPFPAPPDPAAMVQLATRYEHAEGVERDYLRAASLYCSAAREGNADGLYGLGWMFANGRGMPVNDGIAGRLFALAARKGHAHAATLAERFVPDDAPLPPCMGNARLDAPGMAVVLRKTGKGKGPVFDEGPAPARDLRNLSGARIHKMVTRLAKKYDVDPNLALAIMYMESGFNARARSPKNAHGLMQLIPETAQRFNVRDIYDEEQNIRGGLAYLRWLLNYFRGNVQLAAAAYNAGETAVDRYKGVPPFAETRAYVARLAGLYRRDLHPYKESDARAATSAMAAWRARHGVKTDTYVSAIPTSAILTKTNGRFRKANAK